MSDDKITELLSQRGKQWGDAGITHSRIAQVWSGILNHEVDAQQVALCLAGLKLVRACINPDDPDSYDDAHGYTRIAEGIIFGEPGGKVAQVPEVLRDEQGRPVLRSAENIYLAGSDNVLNTPVFDELKERD